MFYCLIHRDKQQADSQTAAVVSAAHLPRLIFDAPTSRRCSTSCLLPGCGRFTLDTHMYECLMTMHARRHYVSFQCCVCKRQMKLFRTAEEGRPWRFQMATLFSTNMGSKYVYGTSRFWFLALMVALDTWSSCWKSLISLRGISSVKWSSG